MLTEYLVHFVNKFLLAFLILDKLRQSNNQFFFTESKHLFLICDKSQTFFFLVVIRKIRIV